MFNRGRGSVPTIQVISSVGLTNTQFTGNSPVGTVVGTIVVTMFPASPTFNGQLALSGVDAAKFQVVGSDLQTNAVNPVGAYSINVNATQGSLFFSQPETINAVPFAGPVFPLFSDGDVQNIGFVWQPSSPVIGTHNVVSGTIVVDGIWRSNGGVETAPNTLTIEWMVDGVPDGTGYHAGPAPYSWDTTVVPDGTHVIYPRVVDSVYDRFGARIPAYFFQSIPVVCIVANIGTNDGAQLVPCPMLGSNFHVDPSPPDFVTYPGTPQHCTVRPYPTQFVAPSSSILLRDQNRWYVEGITEVRRFEYSSAPFFYTTPLGGVLVRGYTQQDNNGLVIEGAYGGVIRQFNTDGGRNDNMITPYCNFVPSPDGTGWTFVDLAGRVGTLTYAGAVTTIAGTQNNRALLPYDYSDPTLTEEQIDTRNTVIGTISGFGDFGGANDLCYDPRDPLVIYVAKTLDHCIIKISLHFNPPHATLFAGHDGVSGTNTNTTTAACFFDEPYSICMNSSGTMYVADFGNCVIRAIDPTGTNITDVVGLPNCPSANVVAATFSSVNTYSAPGTVAFASAYIPFPTGIRLDSSENIVLSEAVTLCVRVVDLTAHSVRRVGRWSDSTGGGSAAHLWFMHDVDAQGTCGPVDDIILLEADDLGSASIGWRFSHDGTYSAQWGNAGGYLPEGYVNAGVSASPAHYPWGVAISRTQARMVINGVAVTGVSSWRPLQPGDPPFNFFSGTGFDQTSYQHGQDIFQHGTCLCFAWGARPSFRVLMGALGDPHLGSSVVMGFDDIVAEFPTDDVGLANYIRAGMGGAVPRPEITGNDMIDLIYFIRRSSLAGSYPVTVVNPTHLPPGPPIVISGISAVRLSATSMQVVWTTNVPTLGCVAAGSVNSQSTTAQYNVWALEETFGTTHNVVVTGLPTATPTYYAIVARDTVG